eukprot:TRINITY_DN19511_c0_g1_i1.p1 TRINITY_DN19511_c0_g1~~TRINITY_DN19511_c0_g1_i1.p1  ORF type:complete len:238 (-),score=63.23 TRINITY_DN19511_c0_g1_i1:286-999(-)
MHKKELHFKEDQTKNTNNFQRIQRHTLQVNKSKLMKVQQKQESEYKKLQRLTKEQSNINWENSKTRLDKQLQNLNLSLTCTQPTEASNLWGATFYANKTWETIILEDSELELPLQSKLETKVFTEPKRIMIKGTATRLACDQVLETDTETIKHLMEEENKEELIQLDESNQFWLFIEVEEIELNKVKYWSTEDSKAADKVLKKWLDDESKHDRMLQRKRTPRNEDKRVSKKNSRKKM